MRAVAVGPDARHTADTRFAAIHCRCHAEANPTPMSLRLSHNAANQRIRAASGLARKTCRSYAGPMKTKTIALTSALTLLCSIALSDSAVTPVRSPIYTDEGRLVLPEDYREWVYLSSGFDM